MIELWPKWYRPPNRVTVAEIKQLVAERFHITVADIDSDRRSRTITGPRHLAYLLSAEETQLSYPALGRQFKRDHSTIIVCARNMKDRTKAEPEWSRHYRALKERLSNA